MIQIDRNTAWTLFMLMYVTYQERGETESNRAAVERVVEQMLSRIRENRDQLDADSASQAIDFFIGEYGTEFSASGGVHQIAEQLGLKILEDIVRDENSGVSKDDGTLVDIIANILTNSMQRNILSGKNLQTLRNAVLLPREKAAVEHLLRHMSCARCGQEFAEREMAVLYNDTGQTFSCSKCLFPIRVRCQTPGCREHATLTDKQLHVLFKSKCTTCKDREKGGIAPAQPEEPPQVEQPTEPAVAMDGILRAELPGWATGALTEALFREAAPAVRQMTPEELQQRQATQRQQWEVHMHNIQRPNRERGRR